MEVETVPEIHPVPERTSATLNTLIEGCKLPVNRNVEDKTEWTPAEILSIRNTSVGIRQYYVHYVDFNKRLDEWVAHDRLDLSHVEFPQNVCPSYFKPQQTIISYRIIRSDEIPLSKMADNRMELFPPTNASMLRFESFEYQGSESIRFLFRETIYRLEVLT